MTCAQMEHANTLTDPAPEADRYNKLFDQLREYNRSRVLARNRQLMLQVYDDRNPEPEAQASDRRKEICAQIARAEEWKAKAEKWIDDFILEAAEAIKAERAWAEIDTQ